MQSDRPTARPLDAPGQRRIENALAERRILPVLSIHSVEEGLRLVETLAQAGLDMVEVTLRTNAALPAIEAIAARLPGVLLGAGTLRQAADFPAVRDAGAVFAVSPGASEVLLEAGAQSGMPFLPGVATPSEAMRAAEHGFRVLKLFPAEAIGGAGLLKALRAPLPDLAFCPTGGISPANCRSYLDLQNVIAVGGSWMVPEALLSAGDFAAIERLAREAVALAGRG